jgi:Plastocyanin
MLRRAALAAVFLMLLSTASVSAASSVQVEIVNFAFNPTPISITLGDSVHWHNGTTSTNHTSTADQFGLWSVSVTHGTTSADTLFQRAGTFAYHCAIHPSMHGQVSVPMIGSQGSGPINTPFTLTVALANAPAGFTQQVQKRKGSKPFKAWKSTTGQTVIFMPTTVGTYQFRTRLKRTSDGVVSGWSPTLTIVVS